MSHRLVMVPNFLVDMGYSSPITKCWNLHGQSEADALRR